MLHDSPRRVALYSITVSLLTPQLKNFFLSIENILLFLYVVIDRYIPMVVVRLRWLFGARPLV